MAKMLANRLKQTLPNIISESQSAFVPSKDGNIGFDGYIGVEFEGKNSRGTQSLFLFL